MKQSQIISSIQNVDLPLYHLLPRWNGDTCSLARSNDTHVTCTCFRFASYSVLLQHDSLQGNFYGSSQGSSSSSSGDLQQALSNGGSKRQGEGLDSAAVIAIAVLSACLAIVFIMAAAILAVYYRRVKVSHSMKTTQLPVLIDCVKK